MNQGQADFSDTGAMCDGNDTVSTKPGNAHSDDDDSAVQLQSVRGKRAKNLIISDYNIDSIHHKSSELQHIGHGHFVDIRGTAETKIDDSFLTANFK